jgi:L-histidine N-alpha-methyltransferase
MMGTKPLRVDVHLSLDAWKADRAHAAARSLTATPRTLDPHWFYDEHGSDLFDQITRLPEYYPTRAERSILEARAHEIAACGASVLVELGSGTSDKTTLLLDAMAACGALDGYVPFDVSEETLRSAAARLAERYPALAIHGVVGDFHHHLGEIPRDGRRLIAFLGGTIGNLRPHQRRRFLFDLDCVLHRDDALLIGIDLVKDPARLIAAYDDRAGTTAEFNRNALRVVNRELGGNFDPEAFDHVARWDPDARWIEMRLRTRRAQTVRLIGPGLTLELAEGEEILTEISAKFVLDEFVEELYRCGFVTKETWVSPGDEFALVLAHPYC